MDNLTNFEIYKIAGLAMDGYVFSVKEDSDDEPTYHYYIITFNPNRQPIINKLNNAIEVLNTNNLELVPVDINSPEIVDFIDSIKSTLLPTTTNNPYLKPLNTNDLRLIKTQ